MKNNFCFYRWIFIWLSKEFFDSDFTPLSLPPYLKKTIMLTAEIHTKKGVMKINFFEKDAPNTVKNFVTLAEKGFYNGLIFHRVMNV